jgi:hypothetical protein
MKLKLGAVLTAVAAIAATAVGLTTSTSFAAPLSAGAAAAGTSALAPTSGTETTTFTLTPPAGAACPGDSATGGYRWQTFIASSNVDLAVLAFNASGPVSPGAGTFVAPLYSTAGSPQVNKTTGTGTGALAGIGTYNFATNVPVANGQYNIGYSCTLSGATERYWSTPITVSSSTATTLSFSYGWVPGAITLSLTSYAATSCTVGISAPAASPAATSTTITYTPTGTILSGAVTVSGSPSSATSDVRTGLVQGQAYNVTATQTNVAGTSSASNTVSCTPSVTVSAPAVAAAPGVLSVVVSWSATGSPTNYTLNAFSCPGATASAGACTSAVSGSPFTATGTTQTVSSLTAGTLYFFSLTANYAAGTSAPAGTASATALANTLISETLTVTRPAGALVLTQRCGVLGAMASETVAGFGTIAAETATGGTTGTAPTLTAGGAADSLFGQYPYPVDGSGVPNANYPTYCGVSLGTGALITTGTLAGEYFIATGRLPQITVVDTRDSDSAWTLSGSSSAFTSGANTFSGDYLGWTPQVNFTSGPTLAGYDQVVTAGAAVNPSSVATAAGVNNVPGAGLGVSRTAASANAGAGLGMAQVDTRLKLLIPLTAKNGTYTATLTFSVI